MQNSNGSGFHKFSIWFINNIPLAALFISGVIVLSFGEFVDGVKGVGCQSQLDLVTSPQTIWNRAGCVVDTVRQILPSRTGNTNNTAP
jgi:hypothetical protein